MKSSWGNNRHDPQENRFETPPFHLIHVNWSNSDNFTMSTRTALSIFFAQEKARETHTLALHATKKRTKEQKNCHSHHQPTTKLTGHVKTSWQPTNQPPNKRPPSNTERPTDRSATNHRTPSNAGWLVGVGLLTAKPEMETEFQAPEKSATCLCFRATT